MIGHKIAALSFKQFDHNLRTVPAQLYQIFWVKGFTTAPASILDSGRVRSTPSYSWHPIRSGFPLMSLLRSLHLFSVSDWFGKSFLFSLVASVTLPTTMFIFFWIVLDKPFSDLDWMNGFTSSIERFNPYADASYFRDPFPDSLRRWWTN